MIHQMQVNQIWSQIRSCATPQLGRGRIRMRRHVPARTLKYLGFPALRPGPGFCLSSQRPLGHFSSLQGGPGEMLPGGAGVAHAGWCVTAPDHSRPFQGPGEAEGEDLE